MEELLALEKKVDKLIEEEAKNLLSSGYTQEDLDILNDALEYIAYPIIAEIYEDTAVSEDEYLIDDK